MHPSELNLTLMTFAAPFGANPTRDAPSRLCPPSCNPEGIRLRAAALEALLLEMQKRGKEGITGLHYHEDSAILGEDTE